MTPERPGPSKCWWTTSSSFPSQFLPQVTVFEVLAVETQFMGQVRQTGAASGS